MDTLFIEAIMKELAENLTGALVGKIYQPSSDTLIFKLWNGRETHRLLISVAAGRARLHLTRHAYPNPPAPARFCQLLRARLARLSAMEQEPGERIVRLAFTAPEDRTPYTLVAELTARQGNLVLLDEQGRIVDALKRHDGEDGSRAVLPGREYQPFPPLAGLLLGEEELAVPTTVDGGKGFERWLLERVRPMSPLVARDLVARVEKGASPEQALEIFRKIRQEGKCQVFTGRLDGRPVLSAYELPGLNIEDAVSYSSPSRAADDFYGPPVAQSDGMDERRLLHTAVRRQLKRLAQRKARIEEEQTDADRAEDLRRAGELLLANLHRLRTGMTTVALENYYADPPAPMAIPLEARLTPQENAERYFRRYKKLKRSRDHVARRLRETEEEGDWLERVALSLEEAESAEELASIRRELADARLLPALKVPGPRGGVDHRRGVREAVTPGGYKLFWGTGNQANDHVSRHLCKAEDLWFHALNLPGCHLVLKRDQGGEVPLADQLYAASLAAGYSRGKNEGKVEVMVTEGKWVTKPKGARPGLVTVKQFRRLLVVPKRM